MSKLTWDHHENHSICPLGNIMVRVTRHSDDEWRVECPEFLRFCKDRETGIGVAEAEMETTLAILADAFKCDLYERKTLNEYKVFLRDGLGEWYMVPEKFYASTPEAAAEMAGQRRSRLRSNTEAQVQDWLGTTPLVTYTLTRSKFVAEKKEDDL